MKDKELSICLKIQIKYKSCRRGSIPAKYTSLPSESLDAAQKAKSVQMLNILQHNAVNKSNLCAATGIKNSKVFDVKRGKSEFSSQEFESLKSAINQVRADITNTFNDYSTIKLKIFLKASLIKPSVILKTLPSVYRSQVNEFSKGKIDLSRETWAMIKVQFQVFKNQINL